MDRIDFEDASVFTTAEIASGRAPALRVERQAGTGLWYVLPGPDAADEATVMVTMRELLGRDQSLGSLLAMPAGVAAQRAGDGGNWEVVQTVAEDEGESEEDPAERDLRRARRRQRERIEARPGRISDVAGAILATLGGLSLIAALLSFMAVPGAPAIGGRPANIVIGTVLGLSGLWHFLLGLILGSRRRPLPLWLCSLVLLLAAMAPLALPGSTDPLVCLVQHVRRAPPPDWLARILGWQVLGIGPGGVALLVIALWAAVTGLRLTLAIARRDALGRTARTA